MAEAFNSSPVTIGGMLGSVTRERVIVPTFQRGYMWQKKHIEAFWTDLTRFKRESAQRGGPEKHFFGPIVTLWKPDEKVVELLDGQQRLATTTILFSVIRDAAREIHSRLGIQLAADFARDVQSQYIEKEGVGMALVMGETDKLYFRETIQEDPPVYSRQPKIRTHHNIKRAQGLLMEKVRAHISGQEGAKAIAELKELRQILVSDLVMARIPVNSQRDAFRIFETLNDRGLRLSVPDLLLNHLMGAAPTEHQTNIRALWTEMVERMGRRDINRFLRHMWVSKYGDLKDYDLFTALKDHIEKNSIGPLEFARGCADECESYNQLVGVEDEQIGKEAAAYVKGLVHELDIQAALPLLLSAFVLLDRKDFENVAKWLLVFVTRYSVVGNLDSGGMEDLLYSLARDVRNMTPDPKADPPAAPDSAASRRCASYIKEELMRNSPDDAAVKRQVIDLTLDQDEAKYVMLRLARHIQSRTKELTFNETNLEHIYPQNPKEDEWGGPENQEKLNPLTWHIGNLTIFGRRLNREAANKEYDVKRQHYAQKTSVQMTKDIAEAYDHWDEKTIKRRARSLADLVVEIWNFNNPSRA